MIFALKKNLILITDWSLSKSGCKSKLKLISISRSRSLSSSKVRTAAGSVSQSWLFSISFLGLYHRSYIYGL